MDNWGSFFESLYTRFVKTANPDFWDFMTSGGDELLNGYECPLCKAWFHIDEVEPIAGKENSVKCPHCGEIIELTN